MNDYEVSAFLKLPIEFAQTCLIYPPSVKEVCSNKNFSIYLKLLTITQEEIEDQFVENKQDLSNLLNPFEYLLNNAYNSNEIYELIKGAFYFFTHEPITIVFEQKIILIGEIKDIETLEKMRIIKEDNYFEFQNKIRNAIGSKAVEPPDPNENERIKIMKAKARYRDRVKAKKQMGLHFVSLLASLCCMGIGLTPLNIGDLSYAAVTILLQYYQNKEKYDLDIRSLLAGADNKKIHPKYWIKNLDE